MNNTAYMKNHPQLEKFLTEIANAFNNKSLIKLVISNPKDKTETLKQLIFNLTMLKGDLKLKCIFRHAQKDITKNLSINEAINEIIFQLTKKFSNADLFTEMGDSFLKIKSDTKVKFLSTPPSQKKVQNLEHDNKKKRLIETDKNQYLKALGVTNSDYILKPEMRDKYIQINRYIELLLPYLKTFNDDKPLHIVDMGCGKGYLTFALYDYMKHVLKKNIHCTGIEYKSELVDKCNAISQLIGYEHLNFKEGSIQEISINKIDILIALHACDTATDDAIYQGIKANASLIVCAPCCHKQIRQHFNAAKPLDAITQFGILKERQAEIITDTLRALFMEAAGYQTHIFEFVTLEHTAKNLMLVGVYKGISPEKKSNIQNTISSFKSLFGITKHHLEQLLEQ